MASINRQKNSDRLRIQFYFDGGKREIALPTADRRKAEVVANMVDRLIEKSKTGEPDRLLGNWLQDCPDDLFDRLARSGLVKPREAPKTILDLTNRFLNREGVEKATLQTYDKIASNLIEFFTEDRPLKAITPESAGEFQTWLLKRYREATAKRRIGLAKQFFAEAVKLDWVDKSPFRFCKGGDVVNSDSWQYFDVKTIERVIAETSNVEHRAQIALMRFAGVRGASELYQMDWTPSTIRWSDGATKGSITILADKTKRHEGREFRVVPLAPILETVLRELYDQAAVGELKLFPRLRKTSNPGSWLKKTFSFVGIQIGQVYNLRRSYCCDVMEACGSDAKSYTELTGHNFITGMKHYQMFHKTRRAKAENQILDFWKGATETAENSPLNSPLFSLLNSPMQDVETVSEKEQDLTQVLINKEDSQEIKNPCEQLQGRKWAVQNSNL